jgi:hypothetical protein
LRRKPQPGGALVVAREAAKERANDRDACEDKAMKKSVLTRRGVAGALRTDAMFGSPCIVVGQEEPLCPAGE